MRVRRILATAGLALVGAEAALSGALYWAMRQPPDVFGRFMARLPMAAMMVLPFEPLWMRARAGRLNPGDPAPDFRLPTLDHRSAVQLSQFRGGRPVVLVFGSYT
jgi:hypothetical protein